MLQNLRCEDIAQVAGRFQLYHLLRQYFHNNDLTEQQIEDFLAVASQVTGDSQEMAEGICLLRHARQYPESEAEYEYNTLFVGPGKLLAPPFESYYRNAERTLMQRETMAVRAFYNRIGIRLLSTRKSRPFSGKRDGEAGLFISGIIPGIFQCPFKELDC